MRMTVVTKKAWDIKKGDTVLNGGASLVIPAKVLEVHKSKNGVIFLTYEDQLLARMSGVFYKENRVVCLEPVHKNGVPQ